VTAEQPWWANAVFYQVYPRSFADSDGDGTGDLAGLAARLDYLVELGVDALWLSPFYRSPMADGGYDVADPCDVDPLFGTLDSFDALLAEAHARGLKVTIDIVPNHVSREHPWFQRALAGGAERDRFVIRPGRGLSGELPPNNWPSVFGGPAWSQLPDGQWYLHLFAPEQPDLDWTNPVVRAEFDRIMRFWLDRGVDGFRVDVAHGMAKPDGLPDMEGPLPGPHQIGVPGFDDLRWDRDGVHDYLRGFRRTLDAYPDERMAVGEAWVADPSRLALYVRPDELNLTFNFELIETKWGADGWRAAIERSLQAMAAVGAPCSWVLANHDVPRVATRYGGGAVGQARARAAALVQLALPGVAYVYNGDELGLENVELPDEALQDPTWERSAHTDRGRDGERVPMPWSGSAPPYGFSANARTWLPMPSGWGVLTVAAQTGVDSSMLSLYQAALRLRRELPSLRDEGFEWLPAPDGCLAFARGDVQVWLNAGEVAIELPASGSVVLATAALDGGLPPDAAVWLRS
jgi:alpha-glucosidase